MKDWQKAEAYWAKELGNGRRQPGSGNQPGAPGDVRYLDRVKLSFYGKALLESKQSGKLVHSISISEAWLDKITGEAMALGRSPLFGMIIGQQKWLAMPRWTLDIGEENDGL